MKSRFERFKEYIERHQKQAIFFNVAFLVVICAFLTVRYNIMVDEDTELSALQSRIGYAYKYFPTMIVSAFNGSVSLVLSVVILFFTKTLRVSNFSYTSAVYLVVGLIVCMAVKSKWLKSWKKTGLLTIFTAIMAGPVWGGSLGAMAGLGLREYRLEKFFFYFINEIWGIAFAYIVIYLFLNYAPDWILENFYLARTYSKRLQNNPDQDRLDFSRASRLGRKITRLIIIEALFLGVMAAIYSNTLAPGLKDDSDIAVAMNEKNTYTDWDKIDNTVELENKVSKLMTKTTDASTKRVLAWSDATLAYDVKLVMLIFMMVVPVAILVNRYADWKIARPMSKMARAVKRVDSKDDRKLAENIREISDLGIKTGDEIEDLYLAFKDTFGQMASYIEFIKRQEDLEKNLEIARKANEAKSNFLSNMSHEIRTPINAVLGFDEMIIRESVDPSITEHAREIQNSGKTLLALINDILDFSRIEAGKMQLIPVEYELASMINDIYNMISMKARDKGLSFEVKVDENTPHILVGDEMRLRQCALNILTNAVKYTEEGSVTFSITYEKVDEKYIDMTVSVSDTGRGIKKEDIDRLFSPFERLDEKETNNIEGTGLGISIVKKLLELSDSRLEVESEYGKGSVFSFTIRQEVVSWDPVGEFEEQYEESLSRIVSYQESFHAPDARILVVDDTEANLTVIKGLLKDNLIKIDTADSGFKALELLDAIKYDLVFLDHRMPRMDGVETFKKLRENPDSRNYDTPVIVLTANAISGAREKYLSEGFTDYLSKPVDGNRLEAVILAYLPKEKVYRRGSDDFVEMDKDMSEEKKAIAEAYGRAVKVTGIDLQKGIDNCGGPELLLEVLKDFWLSIDDKAAKIEQYEKEQDYYNYTIFVHGLKSSARAIGAMKLSELAAMLERFGNEGNKAGIHEWTPVLLSDYRSYKGQIAPALMSDDVDDKPEIDEEELQSALNSIREFVEASYFDSADDIMKMLENYKMPIQYTEKVDRLKKLMSEVDRDGILSLL